MCNPVVETLWVKDKRYYLITCDHNEGIHFFSAVVDGTYEAMCKMIKVYLSNHRISA